MEVDHDAARRVVIKTGVSMGGMVYVIIAVGGGIFALRRPRPYSRAFAGISLRFESRPKAAH